MKRTSSLFFHLLKIRIAAGMPVPKKRPLGRPTDRFEESHLRYSEALEQSRRQDARLEEVGYDEVEAAIREGVEAVERVVFLGGR